MAKVLRKQSDRQTVRQQPGLVRSMVAPAGSKRPRQAPRVVQGIRRYTLLTKDSQRQVYAVYYETIKKFKGLAEWNGVEFVECGVGDLINALK